MIRTTYWTRFDDGDRDDDKENFEMRRNVDLQEKVRLNDFSKEEREVDGNLRFQIFIIFISKVNVLISDSSTKPSTFLKKIYWYIFHIKFIE